MTASKHLRSMSMSRRDSGEGFIHETAPGKAKITDDLAAELAGEYLDSVTSAQYDFEERLNAVFDEEDGGPFITTKANAEFASGVDGSNPKGSEPAAWPTAVGIGLDEDPEEEET